MVEKNRLGGTCLNVGCIPAKELLETASVARTVAHAAEFGVQAQKLGIDWAATLSRKQAIIDQLVGGLTGLLKGRKVTVYDGIGRLGQTIGRSRSAVGRRGRSITGDAVILAAGSVPRTLDGFPVDDRRIVTSDELLSIPALPASAVVIGGSAIGCEFASMMSDLGTKVTILEYAPKILPGCDEDATRVVERSFKKRGIDIRTGVAVTGQQTSADGVTLSYGDGETITVETVVISVGRRPATETLGLRAPGSRSNERGFVMVDENCRTTVPGVWAVATSSPRRHWPTSASPRACWSSPTSWAKTPARSPTTRSRGASTATPRWPSPVTPRPRPGPPATTWWSRSIGRRNGRAMIVGDTEGLVKVIAEKLPDGTGGPDPRGAHGRPVGDRTAGPGLPGRQLGSHRRRGGPVHPAPSDPERALR